MDKALLLKRYSWILLAVIVLLGLILRLYKLAEIPGEMWGDIVAGYEFTVRVLSGDWYWRYEFGGDGPLFSYLIAALTPVVGFSFWTIKAASVLAGILLIVAVFYLGKELLGTEVGLAAAFLTAVSKWALIFSRLGKPHILVPLFAVLSFYCLQKFTKTNKTLWLIGCGIAVSLGMYTQAAFWGVPLAVFLTLFFSLSTLPLRKVLRAGGVLAVIVGIGMLPLVYDLVVRHEQLLGNGSFFIEKMTATTGSANPVPVQIGHNLLKNLAMFHIRGDSTFRNNPQNSPQLDIVSGMFFLLGAWFLRRSFFIWIPFFVIQFPSLLDIANPLSTPNAGRSLGLIPWVYTIVAVGIVRSVRLFSLNRKKLFAGVLVIVVLGTITSINTQAVFDDYAQGLPNKNTPFGKIIASSLDTLPENKRVHLIGCCWGDWGQPEPQGIQYVMHKKREFIQTKQFSCNKEMDLVVYVLNPEDTDTLASLQSCYPSGRLERLTQNGYEAAVIFVPF